jgi:PPM family protein phosphatase
MGTTLTALPAGRRAAVRHRARRRFPRVPAARGRAAQLTRDHTWVQQQVDAGMLTPLEARHHPLSSVLNRVLGTPAVGPADTMVVDAAPGDLFLLCSDGLTNMLDDATCARCCRDDCRWSSCARPRRRGEPARRPDNITVLLLRRSAA